MQTSLSQTFMWLFYHKITFLSTICLLLTYHHHHPSNNKIQEFSFRNISSIKEIHTHTYNITIWHIVLFIIFFAYVCLERHSKLHFLYTIREKKATLSPSASIHFYRRNENGAGRGKWGKRQKSFHFWYLCTCAPKDFHQSESP